MSVNIRKTPSPFAWVTSTPDGIFHVEVRNYKSQKLDLVPLDLLMKFQHVVRMRAFIYTHPQPVTKDRKIKNNPGERTQISEERRM